VDLKSVLVTGGAGFIGSNFVHLMLGTSPQLRVVNLDALTYAGSLESLRDLPAPEQYRFVHGDICDQELVEGLLREEAIDTVVHFAAESHVDRSIHTPAPFVDTNVVGTFSLLEAARTVWLNERKEAEGRLRFLHVSTDEVYGSLAPDEPAFRETTPYRPNSPYAASKAASDHIVRAYGHTYGLPAMIANCSNNYGPLQFPEKFVPLMILNALDGKPLPIYGDGQQVRDWVYVQDHCEALLTMLERGRIGETYNIGGQNQPTNLDIAKRVCALLDEVLPDSRKTSHESLIEFVADRPGHDRRYAMDITKIHQELGWRPKEDLESGLCKTVNWYLENRDWVAVIRRRPSYQEWIERNYIGRGTHA
jgi:dTDP-glucose 4,6-dehydratase